MDEKDRADLYAEWRKFDQRLTDLFEKESYKFLPKLEKIIQEKIGWRRKYPENEYERFLKFMSYVENVYLKPSLNFDFDAGACIIDFDCGWSDEAEEGESY